MPSDKIIAGYRANATALGTRYDAIDPMHLYRQVEAFLDGKDLSKAIVEAASDLAAKEAAPVKNSLFAPAHKREMMGILLQSAVNEATRRSCE